MLLIVLGAAGENLLRNPGFEEPEGAQPASWHVFVEAREGAYAQLDTQNACEGKTCVVLHNPDTYAKDPCNNWSQNILENSGGKKLVLGCKIKTENAGGAALWLQCWRKDPWGVTLAASTSERFPVAGTKDWTAVALKTTVPQDTDFMVVRCVLKGAGTAWFDDVRLVEDDSAKDAPPSKDRMPEDPKTAFRSLAQDAARLTDTLKSLRESHETLTQELARMRAELEALRNQAKSSSTPPALKVSPAATPVRRVPPLVPHGYDLKEGR